MFDYSNRRIIKLPEFKVKPKIKFVDAAAPMGSFDPMKTFTETKQNRKEFMSMPKQQKLGSRRLSTNYLT